MTIANYEKGMDFDFQLKGYVFGLRIIRASFIGSLSETSYALRANLKTAGLAALLKKLEIWATTDGHYDRNNLLPDTHIQQNLDKKNRRVEMNYDYTANKVNVDINPPISSQGIPPASPAERFHSDDALTAIMNMMMRGYRLDENPCEGGVKVFDSKQHYKLRMEEDGTKRLKVDGEQVQTLRCNVYYEPISGFDPEDLPNEEEAATPVKVYFMERPDVGLHVPVRMTYKISVITAVIKITDMAFKPLGSSL